MATSTTLKVLASGEWTGGGGITMAQPAVVWTEGMLCEVQPRTWRGINRPGGHGRVTKVHYEQPGGVIVEAVDVKYTIGALADKKVDIDLVRPCKELGKRERRQPRQPMANAKENAPAPPPRRKTIQVKRISRTTKKPKAAEVVKKDKKKSVKKSPTTTAESSTELEVPEFIEIPIKSSDFLSPLPGPDGGARAVAKKMAMPVDTSFEELPSTKKHRPSDSPRRHPMPHSYRGGEESSEEAEPYDIHNSNNKSMVPLPPSTPATMNPPGSPISRVRALGHGAFVGKSHRDDDDSSDEEDDVVDSLSSPPQTSPVDSTVEVFVQEEHADWQETAPMMPDAHSTASSQVVTPPEEPIEDEPATSPRVALLQSLFSDLLLYSDGELDETRILDDLNKKRPSTEPESFSSSEVDDLLEQLVEAEKIMRADGQIYSMI